MIFSEYTEEGGVVNNFPLRNCLLRKFSKDFYVIEEEKLGKFHEFSRNYHKN